jgi:hypothetical protein
MSQLRERSQAILKHGSNYRFPFVHNVLEAWQQWYCQTFGVPSLARLCCDLIAQVCENIRGERMVADAKTSNRLREGCLASPRRLYATGQDLTTTNSEEQITVNRSKSYDIRAVELSGIGGHHQPERRHVFVGIRCPRCNTGYSVAIPPCENNDSILVEAIDGTLSRVDACGSHPSEISFRIVRHIQLKRAVLRQRHTARVVLEME